MLRTDNSNTLMEPSISLQELQKHNKVDDAWIVISGKVYDVSDYVTTHPGQEAILKNVGGDSTQGFTQQPAHRVVKNHISSLLEKFYVGDLSPTDVKHGGPM